MTARAYTLDEVERQAEALPADLAALTGAAGAAAGLVAERLGRRDGVVLIGSGDSRHAALAARAAFAAAGLACRVAAPTTLARELHDSPDPLSHRSPVIAVSASGSNPALAQVLALARARGLSTVAVTGQAESPLALAAASTLWLDSGSAQPAPGIRTYQASLLALLHLARALRGLESDASAFAALDDLGGLQDAQRRALAAAREAAAPVSRLLSGVAVVRIVAAGLAAGSAAHLGAKLTEVAGVPSAVAEPDDWWHVHRFGHDAGQPVVFFIPPDSDRDAVLAMAVRSAERRRLIVIAGESDTGARAVAEQVIAVPDGVAQIARPLVDSVGAGVLAAALARLLGRVPFSCP